MAVRIIEPKPKPKRKPKPKPDPEAIARNLAADVAEFKRRGGAILRVPSGISGEGRRNWAGNRR